MKRRFVRALLAAIAVAVVLATAARRSAQEIQLTGPLAGAPAVRKLRLYRRAASSCRPTVVVHAARRVPAHDPRRRRGSSTTSPTGSRSASGAATASSASTTDLTDQIDATAPRNALTANNVNHSRLGRTAWQHAPSFADQTAKMTWVAAPQLTFTPFRGKLAIFQKIFVDTDVYIHGGVGVRRHPGARRLRRRRSAVACTDPKSFALDVDDEDRADVRPRASRSTRATSCRSASSTARSRSRGTAPASTRAARARTATSRTRRSTRKTRRSSSTR